MKYLQEIKEAYGYSTSFLVSEGSGVYYYYYYYYYGINKKISVEDPHDVWYYRFRDSGAEYDLDVDADEVAKGTVTIFINHRLEDYEGRFLGDGGRPAGADAKGGQGAVQGQAGRQKPGLHGHGLKRALHSGDLQYSAGRSVTW